MCLLDSAPEKTFQNDGTINMEPEIAKPDEGNSVDNFDTIGDQAFLIIVDALISELMAMAEKGEIPHVVANHYEDEEAEELEEHEKPEDCEISMPPCFIFHNSAFYHPDVIEFLVETEDAI